ncbi:MAG: hypothetical protein CMH27_04575 [Micavibrio sp.]|nr:hypothetical protein [Micavibrio sp.]|tara:strand:+ start:6812 stop:7030 length:219 start_codon:yes stop_codon:yes gene_type:complete
MNNGSMADLVSIGRRIANIRAEKKVSQDDLAGMAELNRGYISRIENGHVSFSVPILLKIAKALDVPPADFFK